MTPDVQALLDLVQQFGVWIIFAWLYINERRDHGTTRREAVEREEKLRTAHMNDLREWAGIRQSLYSVGSQAHPAVPRDRSELQLTFPRSHNDLMTNPVLSPD